MSLTLLLDIYLIWSPQALNVYNLISCLDLIFDLLIKKDIDIFCYVPNFWGVFFLSN